MKCFTVPSFHVFLSLCMFSNGTLRVGKARAYDHKVVAPLPGEWFSFTEYGNRYGRG